MEPFIIICVFPLGLFLFIPLILFPVELVSTLQAKKRGVPLYLFSFLLVVIPVFLYLVVPALKEKLPSLDSLSIRESFLILAWYLVVGVVFVLEVAHKSGIGTKELLQNLGKLFKRASKPVQQSVQQVSQQPARQDVQQVVPQVVQPIQTLEDETKYGEEYIQRCLATAFTEEPETRKYNSDPAFARLLDPLNGQQYAQAIEAGKTLVPLFPDFDLIYYWLGSAYRSTQQYAQSRDIMLHGLEKAKRKSRLLVNLGETEWQSGNIHEAVYWWSQACNFASADYNLYLLLSYVAGGVGLMDFQRILLERVDSLQGGQVRLNSSTGLRLVNLVETQRTESLRIVLQELRTRYFDQG